MAAHCGARVQMAVIRHRGHTGTDEIFHDGRRLKANFAQ